MPSGKKSHVDQAYEYVIQNKFADPANYAQWKYNFIYAAVQCGIITATTDSGSAKGAAAAALTPSSATKYDVAEPFTATWRMMITSCFSDTVQDHFRRAVPNPDDIPKTFNGFFTKLDDIFNTSLDLIKKFDAFLAASTAGATRKHSTPEQALAHINDWEKGLQDIGINFQAPAAETLDRLQHFLTHSLLIGGLPTKASYKQDALRKEFKTIKEAVKYLHTIIPSAMDLQPETGKTKANSNTNNNTSDADRELTPTEKKLLYELKMCRKCWGTGHREAACTATQNNWKHFNAACKKAQADALKATDTSTAGSQ
jgi:hypothetical protein